MRRKAGNAIYGMANESLNITATNQSRFLCSYDIYSLNICVRLIPNWHDFYINDSEYILLSQKYLDSKIMTARQNLLQRLTIYGTSMKIRAH